MKKNKKKGMYNNLALITQVGLNVIIPILLGVYLGSWLDKLFKNTMFFTITLLIIGALAGFLNLFKLIDNKSKKEEDKDNYEKNDKEDEDK